MTIQQKAKQLVQYFDYKTFDKDTDKERTKVICTANFDSEEWKDCMDILRKVDEETSLSQDSRYAFTMDSLALIAEQNEESSYDKLIELGYEQEADVYTSDLTEWLNESNYHVEYLSQVLEEYQPKDGFELLSTAQVKAKEETYYAVIEWLNEYTQVKEITE